MKTSAIYRQIAFFASALVFVLIWSPAASPIYAYLGIDCTIFRIIGRGIDHGLLPYSDLFDHKGPLIFYIYAIAEALGNFKVTMTAIQTLVMFATVNLLYRMCRMVAGRGASLVALSLTVAFIATMMGDGSQSEFFELPMICLSAYLTLRLIVNGSLHGAWRFGILQGLSMGAVFLLRPNDAASPVGILVASALVYLAMGRRWREIGRVIAGCACGAAIVMAPFAIYFAAKGIFSDFIYGMLLFNFKYMGLRWTHDYTVKIAIMTFMLAGACACFAQGNLSRKLACWILLPVVVACILTIGNNPYLHYFMVLAPILALSLALCHNAGVTAIAGWVILINGWNVGNQTVFYGSLAQITYKNYKIYRDNGIVAKYHKDLEELIAPVPQNERAGIWNYNLINGPLMDVFLVTDAAPSNRFFVPQHKFFDLDIQTTERIFDAKPRWVLADESYRFIANADVIAADRAKFESMYQKVSTMRADTTDISLFRLR